MTQVVGWTREVMGPAGLVVAAGTIIAFWLLWLTHRPKGLTLVVRIRW